MNAQTENLSLQGGAGAIQAALDTPVNMAVQGTAIVAHPHPLFGGTMDNKVVHTLVRAHLQAGWRTVRFNFRGVGQSAGQFDEGRGEADDLLRVIDQVAAQGPLALAGFSFGAFVTCTALATLHATHRTPAAVVLVGTAAQRFAVPPIDPGLHERTLAVHGETDDVVSLASVMDWARPQALPITVVPAGGHFFHGQLPLLKRLVLTHLLGLAAQTAPARSLPA
jgi:uncharacterized protein